LLVAIKTRNATCDESISAKTSAAEKAINAHIQKEAKSQGGAEYQEARNRRKDFAIIRKKARQYSLSTHS
jgi:hypothetical protein